MATKQESSPNMQRGLHQEADKALFRIAVIIVDVLLVVAVQLELLVCERRGFQDNLC